MSRGSNGKRDDYMQNFRPRSQLTGLVVLSYNIAKLILLRLTKVPGSLQSELARLINQALGSFSKPH